MGLLAGLDSGAASMVQVTKVQRSFKKVTEALKNTKYGSMIKALLKLADFANSEMLGRLREKFAAVRAEMLQGIADTKAAHAQCVQDIADTEAFREQRQADLAVAEEDLATELARWDGVQALFDTLFADPANEQEAISEVIDLVASVSVSEETFERLNQ